MMRIILTESQLLRLFETVDLSDIHAKYYNDVDENIFYQIIKSDPTYNEQHPNKMGKYGKWLLSLYKSKRLKLEDLYKATEYLECFSKYYNRIEEKDINKYKSLQDLYASVSKFMEDNDQATSKSDEVRKIKEGAEKVYEDDEWLIIIPHTEEASCYYGKGTKWCTAADSSNNLFNDYNEYGNLYININKRTNEKYQFHFQTDQFMDSIDKDIADPIYKTIGLSNGALEFYKNNLQKIYFDKLIKNGVELFDGYYLYENEDGIYYIEDKREQWIVADKLINVNPNSLINDFKSKGYSLLECENGYKCLLMNTFYGLKCVAKNVINVYNISLSPFLMACSVINGYTIVLTKNGKMLCNVYNAEKFEHLAGNDYIVLSDGNYLRLFDIDGNCLERLYRLKGNHPYMLSNSKKWLIVGDILKNRINLIMLENYEKRNYSKKDIINKYGSIENFLEALDNNNAEEGDF